uniref:Uncharacterized protein n=1 Tax=viral metagenome TaxID=1070528 RepID=A0A6C0BNH1_9ZZZZ
MLMILWIYASIHTISPDIDNSVSVPLIYHSHGRDCIIT